MSACRSAACRPTLVIPLDAVIAFADPHIRYGAAVPRRTEAAGGPPETPEAEPKPSRRSRRKRRRWSAWTRSAAARRPRNRQEPAMNAPMPRPSGFLYSPMFPLGPDQTRWKKLPIGGVRTATCDGQTVLRIAPDALSELAFRAFHDVSHLLRPAHLAQLRAILDDPEASGNDRFVALDLLKNANIAAGGVLPMCQDTGTAIVFGKKGQRVWVDGDEEEALSWGVHRTYTETNLRYSQMAPLSMFEEVNTGNNLPVQFDIMAAPGEHHADEFHLMFVAKGGGSRQQDVPVSGDAGDPVAGAAAEIPRRQDEDAGDVGLPAVSPGDRHRRHQRGNDVEDGEAGIDELAGYAADDGQQGGTRDPRSGDGAEGAGAVAHHRHRRAVRRQILLP